MLRIPLSFFFGLILGANVLAAEGTPSPGTPDARTVKLPPEIEQAMAMPKGDDRNKALDAAAKEWAQKEPIAALSWALQLPPDLSFKEAGVVASACGRTNGKIAADWLVKQDSPAVWDRLHPLILAWAPVDPTGAAAWCLQAPKSVRYYAFFTMADALCRKDPPSSGDWALKVPAEDDRFAAIHGVAMIWGRSNIPGATTWIKQLKPAEARFAARIIAGDNYSKLGGKRNLPAVKEWVEQLPLSEQDKDYALNGPSLDSHGPLWPTVKR
jgi:hypothetical protein